MIGRILFILTVTSCCFASAAYSQEAEGPARRDNSGRQLAVVVPVVPPSAAPIAKVKPVALDKHSVENNEHGSSAEPQERVKAAIQSLISTPVELSPEMRQAADKAAIAAEGLTKIAWRRGADLVSWVSHAWKQLNDSPRITPNLAPVIVQPPVGEMRPLQEQDKRQTLYYTNEGRLRTVTGR